MRSPVSSSLSSLAGRQRSLVGLAGGLFLLVAALPARAERSPTVSAVKVVALLPLELKRVWLQKDVIEALQETLETKLIESRAFRLLPARRFRQASKTCRDLSCACAAGRSVGAAQVIATRITRLGGACRLSLRVYDTAGGPILRAVQVAGRCSEAGLVKVIVDATNKLSGQVRSDRASRRVPSVTRSSGGRLVQSTRAVVRWRKKTCRARLGPNSGDASAPPRPRAPGCCGPSRLGVGGFAVVEDGSSDDPEPPAAWRREHQPRSLAPRRGKEGRWGSRAVQAYIGSNWSRALALGLVHLRKHPEDQKVLSIVGASACKLRQPVTACRAYLRLEPARRGMLRQVCESVRITLTID